MRQTAWASMAAFLAGLAVGAVLLASAGDDPTEVERAEAIRLGQGLDDCPADYRCAVEKLVRAADALQDDPDDLKRAVLIWAHARREVAELGASYAAPGPPR